RALCQAILELDERNPVPAALRARAATKSAKLRSLIWCSLSLSRPRNSSYFSQTRYVLTTSTSQYSAISLILPSRKYRSTSLPSMPSGLPDSRDGGNDVNGPTAVIGTRSRNGRYGTL